MTLVTFKCAMMNLTLFKEEQWTVLFGHVVAEAVIQLIKRVNAFGQALAVQQTTKFLSGFQALALNNENSSNYRLCIQAWLKSGG